MLVVVAVVLFGAVTAGGFEPRMTGHEAVVGVMGGVSCCTRGNR